LADAKFVSVKENFYRNRNCAWPKSGQNRNNRLFI